MKYFCLSFDLEEFDLVKEVEENSIYKISFDGTKKILSLLDSLSLNATFFVTVNFARKYPALIKDISNKHEVALHGYKHSSDYQNMSDEEAFEELSKAKKEIEDIISKDVYGFRAPRMRPPSFKVLKDLGLKYDASLHPTYVPGRYNNFFKPRKIFRKENVTVIPATVTPLVRAPISWLWFRNMGLNYAKMCTTTCFSTDSYVSIYFHPWEFVSLKDKEINWLIKRNTGQVIYNKLEKYLKWLINKKTKFITLNELTEKNLIK